jgi:uncharacterized membrane protein YozB (DUF420 family)
MTDFLTSPGFLGTHATLRSDLTLVLILITAILFNIGFILARRKQFTAHRWVQTVSVILNTLVVIISMVTSFIIHILPGIPSKLNQGDYAVTTVHGLVGAVAVLIGLFVMLRGNELMPKKLRFKNYKLFMRLAYTLYMLATLGGVAVYVIVFVFGI